MKGRVEYRPPYFNRVAFANIPGGWEIILEDGVRFGNEDTREEAVALAERWGYEIEPGSEALAELRGESDG